MTASPIRVLQVARDILRDQPEWCLYNDPRYDCRAAARRADGEGTAPENALAVSFTLVGSVGRAVYQLTGKTWIDNSDDYDRAMRPLHDRVTRNRSQFFRICDKLGREGCLKLLDEVLTFD